jgi:hypothetical protein
MNQTTEPLTLSAADAVKWMQQQSGGKFFSLTYKGKDGVLRENRQCRMDVKKHLAGGKASYVAADHDLIVVYDVGKKGYRSINISGLVSMKAEGIFYKIVQEEEPCES